MGMGCGRPGSACSRGGIATFFFQAPSMASSCRETQRTRSAVRSHAELAARPWHTWAGGASMSTPSRLMGAEVKRKEDPRLVTGASAYVGDVRLPGLHYVAFVRSPHAHAAVRRIDARAALKRPGVVRVVTGEELKAHVQQIPLGGPSAEGGGGGKT